MTLKDVKRAPVAIGGLGGSGTRVVAQILMDCGYYMGQDLNVSNDNLWFTVLLRRPLWFSSLQNAQKYDEIYQALNIFQRLMLGGATLLRANDWAFINRAEDELSATEQDGRLWTWPRTWLEERRANMMKAEQADLNTFRGWGWKEPNTHVFLPYAVRYFEDIKYIHVIRHGLDMAYSTNHAQLYNWGHLYGVELADYDTARLPRASLLYWYRANARAFENQTILADRFLVLNFDQLCASPPSEIKKLLHFLELDDTEVDIDHLVSLPVTPSSTNRYKTQDLSIFTSNDLAVVQQLGFVAEVQEN